MARHTTLTLSAADLEALGTERYEHPDPRVQQRMEVLWLISQGETQARSGQLAGVSKATVARSIAIFRRHGVAGLKAFQWVTPVGALEAHRTTLEAEFRERPPHTVAEAAERIETLTGVRRKETRIPRRNALSVSFAIAITHFSCPPSKSAVMY